MTDAGSDDALIERARAGDAAALERLLLVHHDRLLRNIERHLPAAVRAEISAEDVVQETLVEAFRRIGGFTPRGDGAFYRWLVTIARHEMLDMLEKHRALKRGRRAREPIAAGDEAADLPALLELVAVDLNTPSRCVARREAVLAVRSALEQLKPQYREAIRLRYLERLPVAEVAARIGRSAGATQMLCGRALAQLQEILGSRSRYLSRGA